MIFSIFYMYDFCSGNYIKLAYSMFGCTILLRTVMSATFTLPNMFYSKHILLTYAFDSTIQMVQIILPIPT